MLRHVYELFHELFARIATLNMQQANRSSNRIQSHATAQQQQQQQQQQHRSSRERRVDALLRYA